MTDVVDKVTRSRMMAGIRGSDTVPEMIIRRGLHALGFRYRLHDRKRPGRPDLVFPRYRAVVFVNGCFWHRHEGCRYASTPATRPDFWTEKFRLNVARDRKNVTTLLASGWRVALVWECALKDGRVEEVLADLADWLEHSSQDTINCE